MTRVHDQPSKAKAEKGDVVIYGPDGLAITLTAEAALQTSERIEAAAVQAIGQKKMRAESGVSGTETLEHEKHRYR